MLKLALVAGLLTSLLWAGRAEATEPITVDGNLTDLIGAIGRNQGPSNGGFPISDGAQGEIYTGSCHFVNGYDVRNYYFFLDFKNGSGGTASNVRLFGGWDVFGTIGDVDGDGNPNTFNPPPSAAGCPLSDEPGIGPLESYTIEINYDCDAAGLAEQRIIVKNGTVVSRVGTVETDISSRSQFVFVNGFLELRVDNFQSLVPPGADLCSARIRMTANAELDLLGEDRSTTQSLAILPTVSVTKTPSKQSVCPGEEIGWTIVVTNNGLCNLESVVVRDTLDAGLAFASSVPARSAGGTTQRSEFSLGSMTMGESRTITLRSTAAATCAAPTLLNRVGVEATDTPPALCGPATVVTARATATLNCAPCGGDVPCAITVTPGTSACVGSPLELCGPVGSFTYRWTLPNGSTVTTRCVTIAAATPADAGRYVLAVTAGATTTTCETMITVRDVPCSITGPKVACLGSRVELCGPEGAFLYRWVLPGGSVRTTRCIVIDPATLVNSGTYCLTVTDPVTGCSVTCCHDVVISPLPQAKVNGPNFVCFGAAVQLCAPEGNYNYLWTLPNGSGTTTSRCITIAAAALVHNGTYHLVITDRSTGCVSAVDHFLTVTPPLDCTISGSRLVCLGAPFTLTGPAAPAGTTYSYRWTLPGGEVITTRAITIGAATAVHNGLYTLEVTDLTTGCKNTCSQTVEVTAPPCEITGPDVVCAGTIVQLCGPQGNFSYLWTLPGGATFTTRCINLGAVTVAQTGIYTLRVTDLTTGCSRTCDKKLQVNPAPPCSITGPTSVCVGGSLQLCGPEGSWTFHWTLPDGRVVTSRCVTIPVVTLANAGSYTLVVIDPASACSTKCDRKIPVFPAPPCSITGPEVVCLGAPLTLCGPDGAFGYIWRSPSGAISTARCITIPAAAAGDGGLYTLRVTDPAAPCTTQCTKLVRVGGPLCAITRTLPTTPGPGSGPGTTVVCAGQTFELCGPEGAFTYVWTLPNGSTRTTRCIRVDVAGPGDAGTYRLTVTDPTAPQCPSTCTHDVTVNAPPPCAITGPISTTIGASVQLCGPAGTTFDYLWTRPNATTATTQCITIPSVTPADTGLYTLRVTDRTTGCSTTCSHRLTLTPPCALVLVKTATPDVVTAPQPTENCDTSGRPTSLSFRYTGLNCSATHHSQDPGKVICQDFGALPGTARIVITDNATQGAGHVLFDGSVTTGSIFEARAATGGLSTYATNSWAYVFSGGTLVEKIQFHTSCSQPLLMGDQYGTLTLVGFNGSIGAGSNDVTYTYVVTNNGAPLFDAVLSDDKLGVINPDFDLASGASRTFTKTAVVTTTTTNVATVRGRLGSTTGPECSATDDATVRLVNCACAVGYPDNSNPPRSLVVFNESEVLRAFDPANDCAAEEKMIKLWYNDEHALTLGVRRVIVKNPGGALSTTDYAITPTPASPTCVDNPLVGTTASTGDQSGNDVAAGGGRPLWPALFITDLTVNGDASRAGDWQQGGVGIPPHRVCGTWKGAVRTVDNSRFPAVVTVTPDDDPAKNDWNLGGGDPPPAGAVNQGYGAEVVWFVDQLDLIPGHTYRLYFMVHDGDQNKSGGDVGHACTVITVPTGACAVKPSCLISGPTSILAGGTATLCGPDDPGLTYRWNTGATTRCITVGTAGTYSLSVTSEAGCTKTCSQNLIVTGLEDCTDGKPRSLVFEYTGQGCSASNNPQSGKFICQDLAPLGTDPVSVVYTGTDAASFSITPSTVSPGQRVTISAVGRDRFNAQSNFEIRRGSTVLQRLSIHTSCSQRLVVGDVFGSLALREFHTTLITAFTSAGTPVNVQIGTTTDLKFDKVVGSGTTSLSYHVAPTLPAGLAAVEEEVVKLGSTAAYDGGFEVRLDYDPSTLLVPETALKLMRYDGFGWTEITSSVDAGANTVIGRSSTLAQFAIAQPVGLLAADGPIATIEFGIRGCYPNPTNGSTTIRYALPHTGHVRLSVHDVQGREVASLFDGTVQAGERSVAWNGLRHDGRRLATGIYLIRIESADGVRTGKLVLVK